MASLIRLYDEQGQSPWLDNLTRTSLQDGAMAGLIARGVRGVTANPTIVAKAIESSDAYDHQLHDLLAAGHTLEDAYWELAITDVVDALELLRPTYDASEGADGFVSIEVAPDLANDTDATIKAARDLHERIREPNLLVKIPATSAGVPAIEAMVAEGRSINVTLVFSLARYRQVLEAYLSGLEALARRGARPLRRPRRGVVLRQPGGHRGRPTPGGDRHRRGARAARPSRRRAGQARLPAVPRGPHGGAVGTAGRPRRPGATAAVGIHLDQEPPLPRHPLRREPDRARHRQHPAGEHAAGLRGPRQARPHDRRRARRSATWSCTRSPGRASTWTTSGKPWSARASPPSRHRSPTSSAPWKRSRTRPTARHRRAAEADRRGLGWVGACSGCWPPRSSPA